VALVAPPGELSVGPVQSDATDTDVDMDGLRMPLKRLRAAG
jgi:hypothetical protein